MAIEEIARKKYVEENPFQCPFCGSANITTTGDIEGDGLSSAWQSVVCNDCQKRWTDVYKLVDVEEDSVDGNEEES